MSAPRYASRRSALPTYGPALVATASQLGLVCPCGRCESLMPWQVLVADGALEHDAGRLVRRNVRVTVPRQSGKTTLMLSAFVRRMLATPRQTVAYGAQTRLAARSKLLDTFWPIIEGSSLRPMFDPPYRAMGSESLRAVNGSRLVLLSAEESAGHGETLDFVVLDECWAMGPAVEQAVRPAMVTRPNAQMWQLSTAGPAKSVWWRSQVDAGRLAVETGADSRLAYFEWSCPADIDPTDPEAWPTFMPALGHTITAEVVQADMDAMQPSEWRRAYANQWPDESDEGWTVIDRDLWGSAAL